MLVLDEHAHLCCRSIRRVDHPHLVVREHEVSEDLELWRQRLHERVTEGVDGSVALGRTKPLLADDP